MQPIESPLLLGCLSADKIAKQHVEHNMRQQKLIIHSGSQQALIAAVASSGVPSPKRMLLPVFLCLVSDAP